MTKKLEISTNFMILIFSLLVYLAWQTEAKEKSIEKMIEDSKNKHVTSLSCHVCHSEMNETCLNFTQHGEEFPGFPSSCESDHVMCVVKKFAFTSTDGHGATTPMKTFSVKRNCTKRCEDGCVVMGERTRLYVCSQCCSTPLCNVGSGSGSVHYHIENSIPYFLTSVANVHLVFGTLRHVWHLIQISCVLSLRIWI